ncbi:MAG: EAL domain-containing protein [Lachnospiraceae bacterium]|nr:EAL domain-containing protein [Lachnospiraceae bacterium]
MTETNTEKAKQRLDSVFDAFSIVADDTYVFLCDMRYDYSRWSKALVETFGLPSEYMYEAGKIWEEHIHPDDRQAYKDGIDAIFSGEQAGHDIQYRAKLPNGEYAMCTCRGLVIKDENGNPEYFGGAIRNHSQKKQIDNVTGLRNQYGFFADLSSYIRNKTPIHIGMTGIAKLTEINEVYGYDVGNKILQNVGRYLMDKVTNRGGTYRLDGSRFAIITTVQTEQEFADQYEKFRSHYRKGVHIDDMDILLELQAGMLSLNDFNVDTETVYSCLTYAYQQSKLKKHGDLVKFKNDMMGHNRQTLAKLHAIRASIAQDFAGFFLLYQPIVDASTEKLLGVEALLRWKNAEYGVVPPDMFIPFLETDPIFPVLGEWIIETALRDTKRLIEYVPDAIVHINLSYSQMEKAGFSDTIWNLLDKVEFAPNQLSLEITERCRLLDMDLLRNVIVTLRAGGVRIALDDFGTGFSSLGLVKNLPFDTIKIDRSFVQHIETDEREKKLLNNCTDLAGNFGADVCVEGVETSGMRDIIKDYGIHSFQGYYYSKPISIDELLEMVKNGPDCFNR